MENQIEEIKVASKPNALECMADRLSLSPEKLQSTLKKTVFKGCRTDEEFAVLVAVSNEYELNPLTKQIYAFPAKGGGVEPIVSIDGWLKIMNSQTNFDGMKVTVSPDGEEATCEIYCKNRSHPTVITEYFSECSRPSDPWKKMPKRMLRHKAIMQCIRVAFGVSGIHDEDEAKDIDKPGIRNVTKAAAPINPFEGRTPQIERKPEPVVEEPKPAKKVAKKAAKKAAKKVEPVEEAPKPDANVVQITAKIADYTSVNGVNPKTQAPYTLHTIVIEDEDGNKRDVKTYSNTIGGLAEFNIGEMAELECEGTPKGVKVLTLEVV